MRSAMPRFSRLGLLSAWRTGVSEGQPGRRGRRPPDPKPKVIRFAGIVRHRNSVKPTRIDRAEWRARLERGNRIIPSRLPAAGAGTLSPPRGRSVRRPGCPSRDTTRHAGESRPRSPSDSRTAGDPRTPTYRGAYQRGTAKRQETLLLAGDAEAATSHLTRANAQHKSLKLAAVLMLLRVAPGFLRALYQWRDRHVYKVKPGSSIAARHGRLIACSARFAPVILVFLLVVLLTKPAYLADTARYMNEIQNHRAHLVGEI